MSNFSCEHCGKAILDTPGGAYTTECEHYPFTYTNAYLYPRDVLIPGLNNMAIKISGIKYEKIDSEESLEEILERMSHYGSIVLFKSTEEFFNGVDNTVITIWCAQIENEDFGGLYGTGKNYREALLDLGKILEIHETDQNPIALEVCDDEYDPKYDDSDRSDEYRELEELIIDRL